MGDWTATPKTWNAGLPVPTAAELNENIRDFGYAFGAWTGYTPTLSGWTLGNGTVSGTYMRVQKFVAFRALLVFGSTTAAASAAPTFTLPSTVSSNWNFLGQIGWGTFYDSGTATYSVIPRLATSTTVALYLSGTNGIHTTPSTTSPFTWTTGDAVLVVGMYEEAS